MSHGPVPLSWYLILSAVLFGLGVAGFLYRKSVITVFMSIELMLNAVNLSLSPSPTNCIALTATSIPSS